MALYTKAGQSSLVSQHLALLGYNEGDTVHYCGYFPSVPGQVNEDRGRKVSAPMGNIPKDLAQWQSEGRGIYTVINKGGTLIDEITECVAFFYEHDSVDAEGLERFQGLFPDAEFLPTPPNPLRKNKKKTWQVPLDVQERLWFALDLPEPTFQVSTGNKSIHSYWVLDQPIGPAVWRTLQTDLLEYADADRSLKNQNRVMRLPGFAHPLTGEVSKLIECSGKRYSYKTLRQLIPGPEVVEPKASTRPTASPGTGSYDDDRALARELLRHIPTRQPGSGTYEDSFKVLAALVHKFGQVEGLALARQWSPDEDWGEDLDRKVASLRGGDRPVTFGTLVRMAENNGYQRPAKSETWKETPKTLKQSQESTVSQDNGYAALRLAIAGALALTDPAEREFEYHNIHDRFRKPMTLIRRIVTEITRVRSSIQHTFTLEDFEKSTSVGIDFLIPRFLPKVGLTCLGGYSGDGKSRLMYEMISALIQQRPFMGFTPTQKCKVLLIQQEEFENTIMNSLEGVGLLFNSNVDKQSLVVETSWEIDDTATLEQWLTEYKPDVVFMDSFRALNRATGINENSPEAASLVYQVQKIMHQHKVSGVMIHHTTKNKEARGLERLGGSSGIPGACDDYILMSKLSDNPDDGKRLLSLGKRNLNGRFTVEMQIGEFPQFGWELISESGQDAESMNLQNRVLNVIRQNTPHHPEGISAAFIKEALQLPKENKSIYKALDGLVQGKTVNCSRSAQNRRVRLYSDTGYFAAQAQSQQGIPEVSNKYPSHVPEVSQDNFWAEGKAKGADPIAFDGSVALYRVNAAPALPKRNPSLLPNPSLVSKTGDGYSMDTFSNADTASVSADSIQVQSGSHAHAEPSITKDHPEWNVFEIGLIQAETMEDLRLVKAATPEHLRKECMAQWSADGRYAWLEAKVSELQTH